jgi:acyl-CoA synthetase (AMP-forming)/AMP-acid ligase II
VRPGGGAAFSVERDGEERLIVVQELERGVKPADRPAQVELIRAAIAREHELNAHDVVLLRVGSVPKTSSGKIQRRACRAAYLDGTLERLDGGAEA